MPTGATKVLVLKFNDYQCPSCRLAWILYKDIIAKYEKAHPGVFMFENRDYPLETECGAGNAGHVVACEAAAAVRMAREKSRDKDLEAALFERQSPSMTRDEVVSTLQQVAQISRADFDSKYAKTLESIRADVQLGQKLGITGTPTFFLNGSSCRACARPISMPRLTGHCGGSTRLPEAYDRGLTIRQLVMVDAIRPKVSRSITKWASGGQSHTLRSIA
jgi:protein-disulfide isomerase